jgi:hypothetical protein
MTDPNKEQIDKVQIPDVHEPQPKDGELSDTQLDQVSGGGYYGGYGGGGNYS